MSDTLSRQAGCSTAFWTANSRPVPGVVRVSCKGMHMP